MVAPLAVSIVESPAQMVSEEVETETVGGEFTAIEMVVVSVQLPCVPTIV